MSKPVTGRLSKDELLRAFEEVYSLYPNIFPLILWRTWELAAYRRFRLEGPVLDVGCGDGRFIRCVWPDIRSVTGIDIDAQAARQAEESGIYDRILLQPADEAPVDSGRYASAFANCSLEHMDRIDAVLANVRRSLKPGGIFLSSVVTDNWAKWSPMKRILEALVGAKLAGLMQYRYDQYHHLVNPFSADEWGRRIGQAGFQVVEAIPILPLASGGAFLLLDQLWHLETFDIAANRPDELGPTLWKSMESTLGNVEAYRKILDGLLDLDTSWQDACGLVLLARAV